MGCSLPAAQEHLQSPHPAPLQHHAGRTPAVGAASLCVHSQAHSDQLSTASRAPASLGSSTPLLRHQAAQSPGTQKSAPLQPSLTPAPGRLSHALVGSRLLWVPWPPAQLHPSCSPHIPRYQPHVGIRLLGPIHKNLSNVSVFPLCCPSLFLLLTCSVLAFPLPTKLHGQEQPRQDSLLCAHGPEPSQKEFREESGAIRDY